MGTADIVHVCDGVHRGVRRKGDEINMNSIIQKDSCVQPGYPLPGLVLRCTHITNHATTSPPARVLRVPDASLVGVWVSWEPCVNWTL